MESTNLKEIVNGVILTKTCSIKADAESDEKKVINLKVKFDGVELEAVFAKALAGAVIQWQNGPGRKNFNDWKDKQVVEVQFAAPGAQPQIDPKTALINEAKAAGVDVTDKDAFKKFLAEKFGI